MKIILNTIPAKKIGGGAFQISLNFLLKTLESDYGDIQWYYFVSSDLDDVVGHHFKDSINKSYFVFPNQPDYKTYFSVQRRISKIERLIQPDLVFSILAPSYFFFKTPEVMRCCNAWDLIPKTHIAYKTLDFKTRIKYTIRATVVKLLMKRTRFFLTQTSTAKEGIAKLMHLNGDSIKVVSNVLPLTFSSVDTSKSTHSGINVVYVAAWFPHKNIGIIPQIADILKKKYAFSEVRFLLTIPFENKEAISFMEDTAKRLGVSEMIVNMGRMKQADLSNLYRESDIGFFPSLLETFSATLLEYMKFNLPIVASDFSFNRDVAEDAALYFEPADPESAAKCLADLINNQALIIKLSEKSKERITHFNSFDRYYKETVDFLLLVANHKIS